MIVMAPKNRYWLEPALHFSFYVLAIFQNVQSTFSSDKSPYKSFFNSLSCHSRSEIVASMSFELIRPITLQHNLKQRLHVPSYVHLLLLDQRLLMLISLFLNHTHGQFYVFSNRPALHHASLLYLLAIIHLL